MRAMLSVIAALTTTSAAPAAFTPIVVDFEDLTIGDRFVIHQQFLSDGVTVEPDEFLVAPGTPSFGGEAVVGDGGFAGGSGLEIGGGSLLRFEPVFGILEASLQFGYFEQASPETPIVNLRIGDTQLVGGDLREFDGMLIDGVQVLVDAVGDPGQTSGTLTLIGSFDTFGVGGLTGFWVDNVVMTVPAPGVAGVGVVVLGGIAMRRRRSGR